MFELTTGIFKTLMLIFFFNTIPGGDSINEDDYHYDASRILLGYEVDIKDHPYQAVLLWAERNLSLRCGGSIIGHHFILTVAQCVYGFQENQIIVRLGSSFYKRGGCLFDVDEIILHPHYNTTNYINNIAVLKLSRSIGAWGENIQAVMLPKFTDPEPEAGTRGTITGWGRVSEQKKNSPQLMAASLSVVDPRVCQKNCRYGMYKQFCVDGKSASRQGDGGAPFVVHGVQYGILSLLNLGTPMEMYTSLVAHKDFIYDYVLLRCLVD